MTFPSLFIFDMDGLMFDTERVFMNFLKEVMKQPAAELQRQCLLVAENADRVRESLMTLPQ